MLLQRLGASRGHDLTRGAGDMGAHTYRGSPAQCEACLSECAVRLNNPPSSEMAEVYRRVSEIMRPPSARRRSKSNKQADYLQTCAQANSMTSHITVTAVKTPDLTHKFCFHLRENTRHTRYEVQQVYAVIKKFSRY